MNKTLLSFALAAGLFSSATAQHVADYHVIPLPQQIIPTTGGRSDAPFMLNAMTHISYPQGDREMQRNAYYLSEYIQKATGMKLNVTDITPSRKARNYIELLLDPSVTTEEGYRLSVSQNGITLSAATPKGIFYGIQMMRKSLPYGEGVLTEVTFPAAEVQDAPLYGYRGMHLDCSRHFFDIDFVKEYIDMLALHQMNIFHWHLTDDQGWRIEIKKYPQLTQIGGYRESTVIGHNTDVQDYVRYGGFYTQEQIKEIVQYAADRYIEVIPEIDMPGHMLSVLKCFPELGCTGGPYEVGTMWGVYRDVLCAGNEKVYDFMEDILKEVVPLFPSKYFHIGGDESPRDRWQGCPKCQAKIEKEGIKADDKHSAEDRLQSYFTKRMENILNKMDRHIIGWDEILEGDINATATIMSWRGMEGAIVGAKAGHDVILAPTSHCYFDYRQQTNWEYEPLGGGSTVTFDQVYSLGRPQGMTDEEAKHILGIQANVWTEYMTCPQLVRYNVLPRMAALSEVQWLPEDRKNLEDARQRTLRLMKLYDAYGWEYAKHIVPGHVVEKWLF